MMGLKADITHPTQSNKRAGGSSSAGNACLGYKILTLISIMA